MDSVKMLQGRYGELMDSPLSERASVMGCMVLADPIMKDTRLNYARNYLLHRLSIHRFILLLEISLHCKSSLFDCGLILRMSLGTLQPVCNFRKLARCRIDS
jgi:hypothetical protein